MPLQMPRPHRHPTGVYYVNARVPRDLLAKVRGTRISLPVAGAPTFVKATDKVFLSLRTKDAGIAKERFAVAYEALSAHFGAVRTGPTPLTQKQLVALAGDVYRDVMRALDGSEQETNDEIREALSDADGEAEFAERYGDFFDEDGKVDQAGLEAAFRAEELLAPDGPENLAWREKGDVTRPDGAVLTYDEAIARLFEDQAASIIVERHLVVDGPTRQRLLREVAEAMRMAYAAHDRHVDGDYSPDPNASRFPEFVPPAPPRALADPSASETLGALFDRWKAYQADKKSAATIRRYGSSVASLDAWCGRKPWRALTGKDVFDWATHRASKISAESVNRNDLVAVSSVLHWTTTFYGGKLAEANPAAGIKVEVPKRPAGREKMFRPDEIGAILRMARSVRPDPRYPKASASRRWCAWICAYSGARIQEVLWLRKQDVCQIDGVWVMDLLHTKTGDPRKVPLHDALIEEGLIGFLGAAPSGYLFVGDQEPRAGATRTPQELRAAELASWIQRHIKLDRGVSPNHAWRHTWVTLATAAKIDKTSRMLIVGHRAKDSHDGYANAVVLLLTDQMRKFPRYQI